MRHAYASQPKDTPEHLERSLATRLSYLTSVRVNLSVVTYSKREHAFLGQANDMSKRVRRRVANRAAPVDHDSGRSPASAEAEKERDSYVLGQALFNETSEMIHLIQAMILHVYS